MLRLLLFIINLSMATSFCIANKSLTCRPFSSQESSINSGSITLELKKYKLNEEIQIEWNNIYSDISGNDRVLITSSDILTHSITNLAAGTYEIIVTDSNNDALECTATIATLVYVHTSCVTIGDDVNSDHCCYRWSKDEFIVDGDIFDSQITVCPTLDITYSRTKTCDLQIEIKEYFELKKCADLKLNLEVESDLCQGEDGFVNPVELSLIDFELEEDFYCDDCQFEWSMNGSNLNFTNSSKTLVDQPGSYELTVTFENGCEYSFKKELKYNNIFEGDGIFASPNKLCLGGTGCKIFIPENSKIDWLDLETGFSTEVRTINEVGLYSGLLTDINEQCIREVSIEILASNNEISIELEQDNLLCNSGTTTIRAVSDGNFDQILWSTGDIGPTITTDKEGFIEASVVKLSTGCSASANIFINKVDLLAPNIFLSASSNLICEEAENEIIVIANINDIIQSSECSNYEYKWYKNGEIIIEEETAELRISKPGVYKLVLENDCSCSTSASIEIHNDPENIDLDITQDLVVCPEQKSKISIENFRFDLYPQAEYHWSSSNPRHPLNVLDDGLSIEIEKAGLYTLKVLFENGCFITRTTEVSDANLNSYFLIDDVVRANNEVVSVFRKSQLNVQFISNYNAQEVTWTCEDCETEGFNLESITKNIGSNFINIDLNLIETIAPFHLTARVNNCISKRIKICPIDITISNGENIHVLKHPTFFYLEDEENLLTINFESLELCNAKMYYSILSNSDEEEKEAIISNNSWEWVLNEANKDQIQCGNNVMQLNIKSATGEFILTEYINFTVICSDGDSNIEIRDMRTNSTFEPNPNQASRFGFNRLVNEDGTLHLVKDDGDNWISFRFIAGSNIEQSKIKWKIDGRFLEEFNGRYSFGKDFNDLIYYNSSDDEPRLIPVEVIWGEREAERKIAYIMTHNSKSEYVVETGGTSLLNERKYKKKIYDILYKIFPGNNISALLDIRLKLAEYLEETQNVEDPLSPLCYDLTANSNAIEFETTIRWPIYPPYSKVLFFQDTTFDAGVSYIADVKLYIKSRNIEYRYCNEEEIIKTEDEFEVGGQIEPCLLAQISIPFIGSVKLFLCSNSNIGGLGRNKNAGGNLFGIPNLDELEFFLNLNPNPVFKSRITAINKQEDTREFESVFQRGYHEIQLELPVQPFPIICGKLIYNNNGIFWQADLSGNCN